MAQRANIKRLGTTASFAALARVALALALSQAPLGALPAEAQITAPASFEKLRQDTTQQVEARMRPLLDQYCKDACTVIGVAVDVDESITEVDDLGFEGVEGDQGGSNLFVSRITVELQVDNRVTSANRDRLGVILKNGLAKLGLSVVVSWLPVTLPQIGQSVAKEEELKRSLEQRVGAAVEKVIATYCPDDCVLSSVAVDGKLVTPDEAMDVVAEELVRDKSGDAILRVEAVDVVVSMHSGLEPETRSKILNVMRAKTRFAAPLSLEADVTSFPESYADKRTREQRASEDPYGLEQLRKTLQIFRELAGTKEIITTNSASTNSTATSAERTDKESTEGIKTETERSDSTSLPTPSLAPWEYALYGLVALTALALLLLLVSKLSSANRDARLLVDAAQSATGRLHAGQSGDAVPGRAAAETSGGFSDEQRREMGLRVRNAELREDLIKLFLDAPRVAKETFSRLLQEEGVEETARYIHIFGHLVIFELLGDPNLQRDLYELSEYYHKSEFDFSLEDEHRLLNTLKTRATASEIRVLTRKQTEQFDFLTRLDATQIFNLMADERPQVQGIVLTQLDHKRRRAVFDLYQGDAKVSLMRELCRADAIPKEYLSNVAKALQKKVQSRPEFDTEQLRSSDILLDLLEKAELSDQRALMSNLAESNPDAARGMKLRLVTVEILPYLKDGHLLDLILSLDRQDLLLFLAGTREHVRSMVLSKAPDELAEAWIEELEAMTGYDDQAYRLVEMKVTSRIRSLANNGAINLRDVNDLIFGKEEVEPVQGEEPEIVPKGNMVA